MNSEYSVGNIRIRFESRARRRWLVVLFYALMAVLDLACVNNRIHPPLSYLAAWVVSGLAILVFALLIVFTWLTDDMRMRGDERETYCREHAYARAYRALRYFIAAAFFAVVGLFPEPNPIIPLLPPTVRAFLVQLPYMLLFAILLLYITLPQAILLWTEPDMEEVK